LAEASSNENLATTVAVNGQVCEDTAYHCDQVYAPSEKISLERLSTPWIFRRGVAHLVPTEAGDPEQSGSIHDHTGNASPTAHMNISILVVQSGKLTHQACMI
jgi:hypothetical protein